MHRLLKFAPVLLSAALSVAAQSPHTLTYAPGKSITLSLPSDLDINIAASGLHRVRFFAQAPDGRVFATGMYNLADNTQGSIYILDGWNGKTHTFSKITHYLDHLRNPNNLAFYTDPTTHQSWLYLPLTDKLVRYKYNPGDNAPSSPPETLVRFPDYGLSYKYGGWHLTRTVALAMLHSKPRVFVSMGSSCNYCQEHEVLRAAVLSMNPDGGEQSVVAQGLRNAVDLRYIPDLDDGALFATDMGDDHLGDQLPEDTFFELDANNHPGPIATKPAPNYGWPTCYFGGGKPVHDTTPLPSMTSADDSRVVAPHPAAHNDDSVYGKQDGVASAGTNLAAGGGKASAADPNVSLGQAPEPLSACDKVPAVYTTFAAHSSPLGFAYFGGDSRVLHDSFLIALHGASLPHIGTGYRVVRISPADHKPKDFLTGFLTMEHGKPTVHGRPCGILRLGPDTFLLTDDYLGLVYFIHPRS